MTASQLIMLLGLFLLAKPSAQFEDTVQGLEYIKKAKDVVTSSLDLITQRDKLEEVVEQLKATNKVYSKEAAETKGKLRTVLLGSYDSYNSATRNISMWCQYTVGVLNLHKKLPVSILAEQLEAKSGPGYLLGILERFEKSLNFYVTELEERRHSFNDVSGSFEKLRVIRENDLMCGRSCYHMSVNSIRASSYVFFILLGFFIVKYSRGSPDTTLPWQKFLAALFPWVFYCIGIVYASRLFIEGVSMPPISKALCNNQAELDAMRNNVTSDQREIENAKTALNNELIQLSRINCTIEGIYTLEKLQTVHGNAAYEEYSAGIEQLANTCLEYISVAYANSKPTRLNFTDLYYPSIDTSGF